MSNADETDLSKIFVNGIDGTTGHYLVPPSSPEEFAACLRGAPPAEESLPEKEPALQALALPLEYQEIDPSDLRHFGWGILFAQDESQAVREALAPLIAHRKAISGETKTRVLDYLPGETVEAWLRRHDSVLGQPDPDVLPYYLLIVGSPEKISYPFQYLLDLDYAVGRLSFETPDAYATYVRDLISYETAAGASLATRKSVAYFGTRHDFDPATQLSADNLIIPLAKGYLGGSGLQKPPLAENLGFQSAVFLRDDATKARLHQLLHDPAAGRPALLFTASHGLGWPKDDPRQGLAQGALLCQDWPSQSPPAAEHYFAAADVEAGATLSGLVAFHFACYGAGTPLKNDFPTSLKEVAPDIAAAPFVAALPKRLLSHPAGAALAVIGHVERAWGYSIPVTKIGPRLVAFENGLRRILRGQPLGHAMQEFNTLSSTMAAALSEKLHALRNGEPVSDRELVAAWIRRTDARNYVLLGDPAARLRVDDLQPG